MGRGGARFRSIRELMDRHSGERIANTRTMYGADRFPEYSGTDVLPVGAGRLMFFIILKGGEHALTNVRRLIAAGVDPSEGECERLYIAIETRQPEIALELMRDPRVYENVLAGNMAALILALRERLTEVIDAMLAMPHVVAVIRQSARFPKQCPAGNLLHQLVASDAYSGVLAPELLRLIHPRPWEATNKYDMLIIRMALRRLPPATLEEDCRAIWAGEEFDAAAFRDVNFGRRAHLLHAREVAWAAGGCGCRRAAAAAEEPAPAAVKDA